MRRCKFGVRKVPTDGRTEYGDEGAHGDRAIYCEKADRYLLGRTSDGECRFCGEDLTGDRYARLVERVEDHGGEI